MEEIPVSDAGVQDIDSGQESDASGCDWELGFDILNIGRCGPVAAGLSGPGEALVLDEVGQYILDTSVGSLLAPNLANIPIRYTTINQVDGPDVFVVTAVKFVVFGQAQLRVVGDLPLIVIATEEIQIDGAIVLSASEVTSGPGADHDCQVVQSDDFQYGAGGGGFATSGGDGGIPGIDLPAVAGGPANGDGTLVPLHGGCRGGNVGIQGAQGGGGGGAIQFVSGTKIEILGRISARGGGGRGAVVVGGGGGGGSGGAIVIQAPQVLLDSSVLNVNGGGGGGGGGGSASGQDGQGGGGSNGLNGGGGGAGGLTAGAGAAGGNGGAMEVVATDGRNSIVPQPSVVDYGGAGGGGGSVGRIRVMEEN